LDSIVRFQKILDKRGVRTTRRFTKGKDIAAACGQLALKEKKKGQEEAVPA
jgi:23S rRNA (adenine2503-C2)-methyltransferase